MQNLFTLVECQLGFPLFNEIEKVKVALGDNKSSIFSYRFLDMFIEQEVEAQAYRRSVTPTIEEVMDTMMDVFKQSSLQASDVNMVCLTGGTSQFPLIQEHLKTIFGSQKLQVHNIYQSVVNGLSQFALKL
jgi:hypothetical chaperone protein